VLAQDLFLPKQKDHMKPFMFFFIVFSLAELMFSGCYYFLVGKIDKTILLGAAIYIACMITAYIGWRTNSYLEKRKALIDSLP
jgi:predicted neutral ceramidase superfamily lipid hydrolase